MTMSAWKSLLDAERRFEKQIFALEIPVEINHKYVIDSRLSDVLRIVTDDIECLEKAVDALTAKESL